MDLMFKLNSFPLRVLLGLVVLTLLTTPALVAETPHLAATQLGGTVVTWQPQVEYEQLTLRVVGPTGTFTRVFEEGEVPFFDLATLKGAVDGSYTFELTASPRLGPEVRKMLQAARERGEDLALERRLRTEGILPAEPLIQSGYLTVTGGQFVDLGAQEPTGSGALQPRSPAGDGVSSTGGESVRNLSAADQVILDDLIVDGSACIGNDCVNGESFGFDTIRLKENNLRIKFQDTSSSASFPSNDWQLTANDSANGGANKFSIDDIDGGRTPFTIEASAPSNSLYVDDGGRLGLGTSTPVVELHVVDGDTPTLRLEQNGSSGFTPQTWDVAGNETNFFVRDVTNGSTLPFRIRPGAGSSSIIIDNNSNVLINGANGTTADAALHVKRSNGTASLLVQDVTTTVGERELLTLENHGKTRFGVRNTNADSGAGATWRFAVLNTGDFEFSKDGTGVAEFLLDGSGNLTITGSLTTAGGTTPDYVFEPDYELPTLEELESFVRQNRHLPNIPSAREIEEAGAINLTDFQMRLLEKIEELTLYTLGQEQSLTQLREENRYLQARLSSIEHMLQDSGQE